MLRGISNSFKIFQHSWSIASWIMSVVTSIALFITHYIVIVLMVGIPVLAIVGIYSLVRNKKDNNLKEVDENTNANISNENSNKKIRKKYNLAIDIVMIVFTCGLWIIWMIFRPKYEK